MGPLGSSFSCEVRSYLVCGNIIMFVWMCCLLFSTYNYSLGYAAILEPDRWYKTHNVQFDTLQFKYQLDKKDLDNNVHKFV